jgi:AraC-like DNA-binding protein
VGYRMLGFEPGTHRGLPSRHLTFIVTFDAPLDLTMPGTSVPPSSHRAMVSGLHDAPALIHHDGNQHGIHILVTPEGSRGLFRMPPSSLAGTVASLDDALGPAGRELVDRLSLAEGWPARFAILDQVLSRQVLGDGGRPRSAGAIAARPREVGEAWRLLVESTGSLDVDAVAHAVGWSRRHLAERFRTEIGLPPKVLSRVLRFERAKGLLMCAARPRLADVAAACGYADQAHMTREWKALAGVSPSGWLADEKLPFVQDDEGAESPSWDA